MSSPSVETLIWRTGEGRGNKEAALERRQREVISKSLSKYNVMFHVPVLVFQVTWESRICVPFRARV